MSCCRMIAPKDAGSDGTPSSGSDSGASTEETADMKVGRPAALDHWRRCRVSVRLQVATLAVCQHARSAPVSPTQGIRRGACRAYSLAAMRIASLS